MSLTVEFGEQTLRITGALTAESVTLHWPLPNQWFSHEMLILMLVDVEHIDSAGLAWLIEIEAQQRHAGGAVQWHNCPQRLKQLMTLYDLSLNQQRLTVRTES